VLANTENTCIMTSMVSNNAKPVGVKKMKLSAAIKEYVAQANANYIAVRARIMEKAATANNDLRPTVDSYGRLHAPCEGYSWEGEVYGGGSYLPLPADFYEMLEMITGKQYGGAVSFKGKTTRIKTTVGEAAEIAEACAAYAKVGTGKVWDDGVSCYCYIETSRDGLDSLLKTYAEEAAEAEKADIEARRAAERLLKGDAPEGRTAVKGKILAIKEHERASYSYYDSGFDWKMLVEMENKSTVWGTVPSSLDADVGDVVEFTATFEVAQNDKTHAYFKRPSKAKKAA